jgi:hypothetical protein
MSSPVVPTNLTKVAFNKGDRVRANWFSARPVSLAGVQMKLGGDWKDVTGIVRHIRADDPHNPTEIRAYLDPDNWTGGLVKPEGCTCEGPGHVEVKPAWIVEVL